MKRLLCTSLFAAAIVSVATAVNAASWGFQPSYYSHQPPRFVQVGPPQNRGDSSYYAPSDQGYFSASYRWSNNQIQSAGGSWDTTQYYEGWFKTGEQR